jgi:hypothetical protein
MVVVAMTPFLQACLGIMLLSSILLGAAWLAFVAVLRLRELEYRKAALQVKKESLGAIMADEGEPLSDAQDAFRERVARRRANIESETGLRV